MGTQNSAPKTLLVAFDNVNTLVLTRDIQLVSDFAADQLHKIATKDSLAVFMAVYIDIFGTDIPSQAYADLYADAQANADILRPKIEVKPFVPSGAKASFNTDTQIITVLEDVALAALEDNAMRGELMTMLIEEYGHYLDYLLRNHYAKTTEPDAQGDEGARYAYDMYTLNPLEQSSQYFADVTIDGSSQQIVWDFSEVNESLKQHVGELRQQTEDRVGNLEFFKAGKLKTHGLFGHQDVTEQAMEALLKRVIASDPELDKVIGTMYLGNWLRDFSQAVDPMIVRPMSAAVVETNDNLSQYRLMNFITNRTKQVRPVTLSVEVITTVIELAAAKEFLHHEDKNKRELDDYQGHINTLRRDYIHITPDVLGVYRPEEHIDNPKGVGQDAEGKSRQDKELYRKFVGCVADDHPLHDVNRHYGLKNYIRHDQSYSIEGDRYPTSYQYIVEQLKLAGVRDGLNNPRAQIDFGAAMHTLEDYFAHTNFAEVSLIKSVEPLVFPWVDEVAEPTGFRYHYKDLFEGKGLDESYVLLSDRTRVKGHQLASYIPIVTGTFGVVDTAASVLPILNEHLFSIEITPWEKAKPGERTFSDILIRELLADVDRAQQDEVGNTGSNDSTFVDAFDVMLSTRDVFVYIKDQVIPDAIEKSFHWITEHIKQILNFSQYFMIRGLAASLNDAQVALDKDLAAMEAGTFQIGVDPSHTQVAKDDPTHPVHELAGLLAVEAVRQVGREMLEVWNGNGSVESRVLPILDRIVRHPSESDWQDSIVVEWAEANRGKVCAASTPSIVVDRVLHSIEEIDETLASIHGYLSGDAAVGKVVAFFTSDEEARNDVDALKNRIIANIEKSRGQLARAKSVKSKWDAKFPKPAYCSTGGPAAGGGESTEALPQVEHHRVVKGDTLWGISKKHGTTVEALKRLNGLQSDTIYPDQILKIPPRSG
ncbi:MAG: hypothetical protein CMK89_05740 [Pseudomonadales bacterium]|nr:hypothetical protein [Pseudomonadales bacterium]